MYKIYTDGGFSSDKKVGSWAFVILHVDENTGEEKEIKVESGYELDTTNNKMELTAPIKAFERLKELGVSEKSVIAFYSDSNYFVSGMLIWMETWKENGWKTGIGKDVKNQDLWESLDIFKQTYENSFYSWVKGHSSNVYNIKVDAMCQEEIRKGSKEASKNKE